MTEADLKEDRERLAPRQASPRARSQRPTPCLSSPRRLAQGPAGQDHGPDCPSDPCTFQVWVTQPLLQEPPTSRQAPQRPLPPHSGASPKHPSPLPPAHHPRTALDTCWTDGRVGVSSCLGTKAFLPSRAGRTFLKLQRLRRWLANSKARRNPRSPGPAALPTPAAGGLSCLRLAEQP